MADGIDMKAQLARMEKRLDEMAQVVGVLTTDVSTLKSDVTTLKSDVSVLKTDVAVLKADVVVLKSDVAVLKSDVSQLKNDTKIRFEHVEGRFNVMAESIASFREQMHRRFDEAETARKADRQMFYDILGNHEVRIRGLEGASGRPA
jgi:polyhydroxyalkanoate synthesis regulator phasin